MGGMEIFLIPPIAPFGLLMASFGSAPIPNPSVSALPAVETATGSFAIAIAGLSEATAAAVAGSVPSILRLFRLGALVATPLSMGGNIYEMLGVRFLLEWYLEGTSLRDLVLYLLLLVVGVSLTVPNVHLQRRNLGLLPVPRHHLWWCVVQM